MNTYLVTLVDGSTGKYQRILVQSRAEDGMQDFVLSDEVLPTLGLDEPVVVAVHLLRIKRPVRGTLMRSLTRN